MRQIKISAAWQTYKHNGGLRATTTFVAIVLRVSRSSPKYLAACHNQEVLEAAQQLNIESTTSPMDRGLNSEQRDERM